MDDALITVLLAVIGSTTALNLFMLLRLTARFKAEVEATAPLTQYAVGERLSFSVWSADGTWRDMLDLAGSPAVIVFLSPGCPACRDAAADLIRMLPGMNDVGVQLLIMCADPVHDLAELVEETELAGRVFVAAEAAREQLNPTNSAPVYLFVDEHCAYRSSGFVGDQDWVLFATEMRGIASTEKWTKA